MYIHGAGNVDLSTFWLLNSVIGQEFRRNPKGCGEGYGGFGVIQLM
jgi:hypothetical protein